MFHKIKSVAPLSDFRLSIQFSKGVTKLYDINPLFDKLPVFKRLQSNPADFGCVSVDIGGYGIIGGMDFDLSCDELWENGTTVGTFFDGLIHSVMPLSLGD